MKRKGLTMKKWRWLRQKKGSALLLTLLVIATLTGMTLAFTDETGVELDLAGFARDHHRAHEMARSGVNLALALLFQDKDPEMDSLREDWGRFGQEPFPDELPGDLSFSGSLADESGKFNINTLVNEEGQIDETRETQLRRLFEVLGLEDEMVGPFLDWLDLDDIQSLQGAESDYYLGLQPGYRCANGPFLTMGQLLLVKGMKGIAESGDQKQLLDYLTIYSDGKVNINTASGEVLESLSDRLDSAAAEAIIQFRQDNDFKAVEDLKKVPGLDPAIFNEIKPWITVKSGAFSIVSKGACRGALDTIRAVVQRQEKGLRVISWQTEG
jgi:general secretion pathway protein K